jgi:acyl carrier protein
MELLAQVQELVAAVLKVSVEQIGPETSDKSLSAWDSLAHVNLMMGLEQTYDLFLDVEDFSKLTSVSAIVAYWQDRGIT